jgi:6-methylsalicylate decarboxylase
MQIAGQEQSNPGDRPMRIDVHAHFNPAPLAQASLRLGGQKPMGPPHDADLAPRLAAMDEAGIAMALLWPTFQPDLPEAGAARALARLTNDLYAAVMARHPGRFSAWGAVPMLHGDAALAEIAHVLDDLGMAGIGLGCSLAGKPLDHEDFAPIWQELDRRGAAVFIHPGQCVGDFPGGGDFLLGPCLCSPAEIGIAAARLVLSGLTERFPHVRIVLATGGGSLPYAVGKMGVIRRMLPEMAPFRGDLRAELGRFYYDTSFPEEPTKLIALRDLCGAGHLLLGSDQPFGSMAQSIAAIEQATCFDADEKRAILDENAASLLPACRHHA